MLAQSFVTLHLHINLIHQVLIQQLALIMILHRIQSLDTGGFVVCLTVSIGSIVGGGHCFNRIEEVAALFQI